MKKGYQILELQVLQKLFSNSCYDVFAVAIMSWLCDLLRLELREYLEHVEFDVIRVTYAGSYPAIGIHYKDQDHEDIASLVESTIDRILREKSILEFVGFIPENGVNWKDVTARIMLNDD